MPYGHTKKVFRDTLVYFFVFEGELCREMSLRLKKRNILCSDSVIYIPEHPVTLFTFSKCLNMSKQALFVKSKLAWQNLTPPIFCIFWPQGCLQLKYISCFNKLNTSDVFCPKKGHICKTGVLEAEEANLLNMVSVIQNNHL